jgi:hypothetical protein
MWRGVERIKAQWFYSLQFEPTGFLDIHHQSHGHRILRYALSEDLKLNIVFLSIITLMIVFMVLNAFTENTIIKIPRVVCPQVMEALTDFWILKMSGIT